jgi:hypothetical protein
MHATGCMSPHGTATEASGSTWEGAVPTLCAPPMVCREARPSTAKQRASTVPGAASVTPRLPPTISAYPRIPVYARQASMYKLVAVKIHKGGAHEYVSVYDSMSR